MINSSNTCGDLSERYAAGGDPGGPGVGRKHRERNREVGSIRGDAPDDLDLAGHPHQRYDAGLAEGNADEHEPAARRHQVRRGVEERRVSRALDHGRGRTGVTAHLAKLGDDGCCAEVEREPASILHRLDTDDRPDATGMQGRHRQQPDRAEADDHHSVTGVQASPVDAVNRHRQRFDQARVLQRHSVRKPMQQRRRGRDQFRESTVAGKPDAGGERHGAAIRRSVAAIVADATRDLGVDDRGFARSPPNDPVAHGIDDAGDLVAWNRVGEQPDLV